VSDVLRLILRRDRWRLPIWVLAIGGLTAVSGRGMVSTFGTQASIDGYAASIQGSAAAIAMTGPPIGLHTMAGVVINKVSSIALVGVVLMVVFEVVRHTRTEEEEGRTELVRSTVVGRHTAAVAALLVACVASLAVGVLVALALLASTAPASAAWVFGGGIAGLGIVFAALTLLLAQVFSHGRTVLGAALAALGVAYVVRAVGDVRGDWLVWLSPVGWAQAVHPLGENRWWPVLVSLLAASALATGAIILENRRDLGAGLVAERRGNAHAPTSLAGPAGLAWRLQRGAIVGWAVGLFALAAAIGSLSKQMRKMAVDSPTLEKYLHATGQGGIVDSFFATMLLILALLTGTFAVSSALRLYAEEASGRLACGDRRGRGRAVVHRRIRARAHLRHQRLRRMAAVPDGPARARVRAGRTRLGGARGPAHGLGARLGEGGVGVHRVLPGAGLARRPARRPTLGRDPLAVHAHALGADPAGDPRRARGHRPGGGSALRGRPNGTPKAGHRVRLTQGIVSEGNELC